MTTAKKISFIAAGSEFILVMNFAALCEIEKELDEAFPRTLAKMKSGDVRLSTIVTMFRAALLKERPGITQAEAMELIEEIGPERAAKLVAEAIQESPTFASEAKRPKVKAA